MRVFYFNITYRCNSSCMFCAADHPILQEEQEMTLEEFKQILDQHQIQKGHRIILNGGEPTIHRDFFGIIDAVHDRGAKIDLFTNGMMFSDTDFSDRVLSYPNLCIRVPLFGASAQMHDRLTGVRGSFEKVIKGLDYICDKLGNDSTLEIKMLMSRITVPENEKIYEMTFRRWRKPNVKLSLNPLLISECVIRNKELFIDTYENMMRDSVPLVHRIIEDGWPFSMDLIPYCAFPDDEMIALCRGNVSVDESFYADPNEQIIVDEMKGREPCRECCYAKRCNGYPESYVAYFGPEVMKPIMRSKKRMDLTLGKR